jgi:hypothetical protein
MWQSRGVRNQDEEEVSINTTNQIHPRDGSIRSHNPPIDLNPG